MSIREKIIDILQQDPESQDTTLGEVADAIIAALPECVEDLVWRDSGHKGQQWSSGDVHKYGLWPLVDCWYVVGGDASSVAGSKQECIDWANTHNRNTIMKAMGVEV